MKFLKRLLGLSGTKNKQQEISFECGKCGKEFETEAELKIHKHKHKSERKKKRSTKETAGAKKNDQDAVDYDEVVTNTIKEIKSKVEGQDVDYKKLLEAEKKNKDRKTLKSWIKDQME